MRKWVREADVDDGAERERIRELERGGSGAAADDTFVAPLRGFVYTAFVIDVFAGVHRRVALLNPSARAEFVLDVLEQAIHDRTADGSTG